MKISLVAFSFVTAVPFVLAGFMWGFIVYCFGKGRELCDNYVQYLD